MRETIHRLILALAGASALSGAAAPATAGAHDALGTVGQAECSAETVREALRADPDFAHLLEACRRRALASVRYHPEAEDAIQEALVRIWRGQPHVFLEDQDALARYLNTATHRNIATRLRQHSACGGEPDENGIEPAAPDGHDTNPHAGVELEDLLATLSARLEPEDCEVLACYVEGESSQRRIADKLGLTRYATGQATQRITQELRALVGDSA